MLYLLAKVDGRSNVTFISEEITLLLLETFKDDLKVNVIVIH